jgi:hypothetical protein
MARQHSTSGFAAQKAPDLIAAHIARRRAGEEGVPFSTLTCRDTRQAGV